MALKFTYFSRFFLLLSGCGCYWYLLKSAKTTTDPVLASPPPVLGTTKNILIVNMRWNPGVEEHGALESSSCPTTDCFITRNLDYLRNVTFDAFVIHAQTTFNPWFPPERTPDQVFVFFSLEPPYKLPNQDLFEDYYNWTMSYRTGSDFVLKYGRVEPLPGAPATVQHKLQLIEEAAASSKTQVAAGKTKLAVWLVSNCNAPSNRALYVKELQKYVQVDIFSSDSRCGGNATCPKTKECDQRIEREYKFYLAFENSICGEYVTEKFFAMMRKNIVPVVLGGADYSAIAPPHSYINALDYKPRELADYLKKLDGNDSLYARYFWWKPYYQIRDPVELNREAFCKLCTALHETPLQRKVVRGLRQWYVDQSHCKDRPNFS